MQSKLVCYIWRASGHACAKANSNVRGSGVAIAWVLMAFRRWCSGGAEGALHLKIYFAEGRHSRRE